MRKLLLISLLFCFYNSFSQRAVTTGFTGRANQTFVVEDGNLSARNQLLVPRFADTTEANTYTIKDTLGAIIYTYDVHNLWVRKYETGLRWVSFSGGALLPLAGTGIATGAVAGSLDGNTLQVHQNLQPYLNIDPTPNNENSYIRAFNSTGGTNTGLVSANSTNLQGGATIQALFDGGTKTSVISLNTTTSAATITYESEKHIFNLGNIIYAAPTVPSSANDTGVTGQIAWDADFFYVCISTNTWVRTALTTWP